MRWPRSTRCSSASTSASGALDEITALASVVAGGDDVQQVIQELVAETKAQRDGFASIDAMAVDRRETLAWRLIASNVVVVDTDGRSRAPSGRRRATG